MAIRWRWPPESVRVALQRVGREMTCGSGARPAPRARVFGAKRWTIIPPTGPHGPSCGVQRRIRVLKNDLHLPA